MLQDYKLQFLRRLLALPKLQFPGRLVPMRH